MAHDVFISYSSRDKPVADAICAAQNPASSFEIQAPNGMRFTAPR